MTHPALEARAREALKPLPDDGDYVAIWLPANLYKALFEASYLAGTSTTDLIVDILRDAFPSEAPR